MYVCWGGGGGSWGCTCKRGKEMIQMPVFIIQLAKLCFQLTSNQYYGQGMWKPRGKRTIGCYSFDLSQSTLKESDIRAANIGVPSDVGAWICQQLKEELQASDTADRLEKYFESSCKSL